MISLEEEAEFYSTMTVFYNAETKEIPDEKEIMRDEYVAEIAFKAGANSKWVQAEKIRAQMDVLIKAYSSTHPILGMLESLEKQLKELEND
jgi:hypothetical protein